MRTQVGLSVESLVTDQAPDMRWMSQLQLANNPRIAGRGFPAQCLCYRYLPRGTLPIRLDVYGCFLMQSQFLVQTLLSVRLVQFTERGTLPNDIWMFARQILFQCFLVCGFTDEPTTAIALSKHFALLRITLFT